jgi:predicted Zn-dependent protease
MRTLRWLPLLGLLVLLGSCSRVEGTNRQRLLLTSAGAENQAGAEAYAEVKKTEQLCTDPAAIALVERVGRRLAAVAPASGFTYEFVVLESPTINAFCLPGGKVAVYTGILPWCQDEASLAAVLGHEIAHAIARHGGERMSQGQLQQFGGQTLAAVLEARGIAPTTTQLTMVAYNAGSQYLGVLPYSRLHESEADHLGLLYMAKAGYDPTAAVGFWGRFGALSSGTPSFLSTHPASADRAAALKAQLSEAQALYVAAAHQYGHGDLVPEKYRALPAAKP